MLRASKKLFLFSTVFVCVLMVTVVMNGSLVCSAANQEYSPESTAPEKVLTILNDVVGLDMATYRTNLDTHNQDLFFETLPQENVKYALESDDSKLEVICTSVNEKLHSMSVYVLDGSPRMTQPATNVLEMAKDFINKYQTYSGASYYGALRPMLDNVEANKNVTKTSGNVKLEATVDQRYTDFRWKYAFNGVEAPSKCVALCFENGFLSYFIDTWSLYKIGSTDINLSEEEAVKIAMDRAKDFSWEVGYGNKSIEVTEFNIVGVSKTTLDFGNYVTKKDARGGEPLTLYPGWYIKLYFDKLYPGNVYGVDVGIWADTGEVNDIYAMFLMGDYSSNGDANGSEDYIGQESSESNNETGPNLTQIAWIALPISIAIVLGATKVYSKRKKRIPHEPHNMPKSNSLKLGGTLLCLLISLTIFSMATPTVKAGTYGMALYGSRWKMTTNEQYAAKAAIDLMELRFTNVGYTCADLYGSNTQKYIVLATAYIMEREFDYVAMFHHGHAGKDWVDDVLHWDYFDDDGTEMQNLIWDYEVYDFTELSKHFFVILWACWQGDSDGYPGYEDYKGRWVGMPDAWHHPCTDLDCFIGFEEASMPLTQHSKHCPFAIYYYWFNSFIHWLTYHHSTIIQALDQASRFHYSRSYYQTELHTGFTAYWPYFEPGPGKMKIYGSPNIRVY